MAHWITSKRTPTYREITNMDTGAVRRINLASDKQWSYLEGLRKATAKTYEPLKNRPTQHHASKQIDKLLLKKQKLESQQKLI